METYGNTLVHGAAHRTGGELTSYLFQHWLAVLVIVIIVLAVIFPPEMLMSNVKAGGREFELFSGEWYTKRDGAVSAVEFIPAEDKIMLLIEGSDPVEVEKPRIFSLFYPRVNAKLRFRAMMPSGKLRTVNATFGDEEMCFDVVNEEKTTYYRDKRVADALPD